MARILDQGDESKFTLADAGHITVWFHNFVAITQGQPDEEDTPTNEQLSALNVRVIVQLGFPLRRYRSFSHLTRGRPPELIISPFTCLSWTALGWRKKSLVQPIFRLGFTVGEFSVWRV